MIIGREVAQRWLAAGSSPVDWCEENYTVSSSVAEFTNTVSNFLLICLPAYCLYAKLWNSFTKHVSYGVNILLVITIFIGVSSVYFHATLSLLGQWLDEMWIIWALCLGYGCLMPNQYRPKFFYGTTANAIATLAALSLTMMWFAAPGVNAFWMMAMTIPIVGILISDIVSYRNPMTYRLTNITVWTFVVAFCLWVADKTMCRVLLDLGIPGLHNIWHVLIAVVSYLCITVLAYRKAKADSPQVTTTIRYTPGTGWGIPYVHCKHKHVI